MQVCNYEGVTPFADRPETMADTLDKMRAKAPQAAEFLRRLANGNRLMILCSLVEHERSVGDLEQTLDLRQPGLSQQLAELRQAGLVTTRRQSRSIYYSLADERTRAVVALLYEIFCKDPGDVTRRLQGPTDDTA
jgi:DNA-binding transcriptional ArsR family regulator